MTAPGPRSGAIGTFFKEVGVAGLLLPTGWFGGRPMEGHHRLTLVVEQPQHLIVELDEQLLLVFSGASRVERSTTDLAMMTGTPLLTISG